MQFVIQSQRFLWD